MKGTKRVLSPQSRSGKWTVFKFNVILYANLTPAFRSEVHIQTKVLLILLPYGVKAFV